MISIFIPDENESTAKRYLLIFTATLARVCIASVISFLLFPVQAGLVSVFLTSFSLIPALENILEKNKNDVWQKRLSPTTANIDMAVSVMVIFLACLIAYASLSFVLHNEAVKIVFFSQIHDTMTHTHFVAKDFASLLSNRIMICFIFFIVSLIFRVGSLFILVWIASVWGLIYGMYFKHDFTMIPGVGHYSNIVGLVGTSIVILKTFAYITACMAGVFLSKALGKYKFSSTEFKQVSKAVFSIIVVSVLLLVGAVYWEFTAFT